MSMNFLSSTIMQGGWLRMFDVDWIGCATRNSLKSEACLLGRLPLRFYANHAEARRDITDYIVGLYNNVRLHSTLGYLPPTAYERKTTVQHPIEVSEIT